MDLEVARALARQQRALDRLAGTLGFLERNAEGAVGGARQVAFSSVSSVAAGVEVEVSVTLPRVCAVERVVTSRAMRVRLYDRSAKSSADASRVSGVLPSGDHGLLVEVDGGTAAEEVTFNPRVVVTNRDSSSIYKVRLKNLSASSAVISGSFWIVL